MWLLSKLMMFYFFGEKSFLEVWGALILFFPCRSLFLVRVPKGECGLVCCVKRKEALGSATTMWSCECPYPLSSSSYYFTSVWESRVWVVRENTRWILEEKSSCWGHVTSYTQRLIIPQVWLGYTNSRLGTPLFTWLSAPSAGSTIVPLKYTAWCMLI